MNVQDAFANEFQNEERAGVPGDLRERLIRMVRQVIDPKSAIPDPFPVDRQLSDLGVSSLKMLNLMLAVEVEFDIAIPQAEITPENFHSVASMQNLAERLLRG